jgi:ligand-binding sensor domain-containing protein/serine phosphatase RsbU (regulator of sigma subunit)
MTKRNIYLFSFLACCLFLETAWAQTMNLNQFGIEEGLPQSSIQTLLSDKQGNIWIGTMGGLSKFNGLGFENFSKKDGMAENRVVSGCIDKNGNIWLGHWIGGISKYHAKTKKFHEVKLPMALQNNLAINCIFEDAAGNIWIGTNGSGLIKYGPSAKELNGLYSEKEAGTFTIIKKQNGLSNDIVNAVQQDKTGCIWVGTDDGVTKIQQIQHGSVLRYNFSILKDLPGTSINTILPDNYGNIWMGTRNQGVFCMLKGSSENIKAYNMNDGLAGNSIKVLFEDKKNNLFIGTYGGGVSKYLRTLEANHYKGPIFQTIGTAQGLSNDKVLAIAQDREQNIWIGTYLNLNQYYDEQFEIYGEAEGLSNSLVWSVIQDRKGNFWLGTEGGLVKYKPGLNPNQNNFVKFNSNRDNKNQNTTALFEDASGNIWFSNFDQGISFLNPENKKITQFKDKISAREIFAITGDQDGNIWIGTNHEGAFKISADRRNVTHYTTKDGLGSNQIYTIFKDSKNYLWFGAIGGHLSRFDGSGFKTFSNKEGYDNKFTVCITEDNKGNIWLGSYNGGLYKYDGKKFKNYPVKEGSSEAPFLLVCDDKNNVWIGTAKGLDKFSIKEETFKHFGKKDGFLGIEINPNAVCKDKDGNLWFGSIIGLVKYNTKQEKKNLMAPVLTLKKPRVFFMNTEIPENHIFAHDQNYLTFDFVGASLTNPQRVKYQYKLEGLDQQWSPITKDTYTTYPNLQPGSYTFLLKAANNDDVWNVTPLRFSFEIASPFWKTWWFYTLNFLLLLLLVYWFVKRREFKLLRQNKILEARVNKRTLELSIEKENVTRQNEEINLQKIELEKKNTHITDSIDAAKSIQEAILPPLDQIKKVLPESFIFYKPKDVVSGDFYWIHALKEKTLLAAVDCTGHGVPGAFMSLLGYNLLESIVKDQTIAEPAAILNKLSSEIAFSLRQNKEDSVIRSGMDIALLSIDTQQKKIEFSGAHNSVYCIRDHEVIELKANRLSIGRFSVNHAENLFTNHALQLQKEDVVYIFSDGYADQIGGPERKKFYYKPFKDLLVAIHKLPMEEQKMRLDEVNKEWRGMRDQTDDILVIGFKIP